MRTSLQFTGFIVLLALTALFNSVDAQQVWKWTDKNNVTHYSDQPGPGAVRVDLHVQTYDSGPVPTSGSRTQTAPRREESAYRSVRISQPGNDDTVSGTGGVVSVNVSVDPGLQAGHSIVLSIDGQRVSAEGSSASSFTLNEVPRGTHTLTASIVDSRGETVAQADAVTFHVLQPVAKPQGK